MEKKHAITEIMSATMEKVREMMDVNTIVGTPIEANGVTLIPVSKLSFGFGSGGMELGKKDQSPEGDSGFGGGGGAGVNISPVAFLVVRGDSVKLLPVSQGQGSAVERVVDMVPEMFDKVSDFVEKNKAKDKSAD